MFIRIGPELLRAEPNFQEFMESLKTP